MPKKSVLFHPMELRVPLDSSVSILDLALKHKLPIDHSCGGSGSCGTCRVQVVRNGERLSPRNEVEQAMAESRGFSNEERLACQTEPVDGLEVMIPNVN